MLHRKTSFYFKILQIKKLPYFKKIDKSIIQLAKKRLKIFNKKNQIKKINKQTPLKKNKRLRNNRRLKMKTELKLI